MLLDVRELPAKSRDIEPLESAGRSAGVRMDDVVHDDRRNPRLDGRLASSSAGSTGRPLHVTDDRKKHRQGIVCPDRQDRGRLIGRHARQAPHEILTPGMVWFSD